MASHVPMGPLKSFSVQVVLPPSGKDHESSSLSLPKTEETFVATFGFLLALPTGACTCKENVINLAIIGIGIAVKRKDSISILRVINYFE
jgi:hypothetical protein